MRFEIGAMDVPKEESVVLIVVRFGKYRHRKGHFHGRQIRGIYRRKLAQ